MAFDVLEWVLTILTWDFDLNIETNVFQRKCDKNIRPDNQLVKGGQSGFNFFASLDQITDL